MVIPPHPPSIGTKTTNSVEHELRRMARQQRHAAFIIVPRAGWRLASVPLLTIPRLTPTDYLPVIFHPSLFYLPKRSKPRRATDAVPGSQYFRRSSSPASLFEYRYLLTLRSSSIRRLGLSCAQDVTTHWKSYYIRVTTASLKVKRASLAETSSVYPKNRVHEHENQKMSVTKGSTVRVTSQSCA